MCPRTEARSCCRCLETRGNWAATLIMIYSRIRLRYFPIHFCCRNLLYSADSHHFLLFFFFPYCEFSYAVTILLVNSVSSFEWFYSHTIEVEKRQLLRLREFISLLFFSKMSRILSLRSLQMSWDPDAPSDVSRTYPQDTTGENSKHFENVYSPQRQNTNI